jgi:hypothetical protein
MKPATQPVASKKRLVSVTHVSGGKQPLRKRAVQLRAACRHPCPQSSFLAPNRVHEPAHTPGVFRAAVCLPLPGGALHGAQGWRVRDHQYVREAVACVVVRDHQYVREAVALPRTHLPSLTLEAGEEPLREGALELELVQLWLATGLLSSPVCKPEVSVN